MRRPGAPRTPVLLGRRQPRVERQDLGVQIMQCLGGVADLALARQEHENVARPVTHQLASASVMPSVWSRA